MIRKILVGVDGSPHSQHAAEAAAAIARAFGARLELEHVVSPIRAGPRADGYMVSESLRLVGEELTTEARAQLEEPGLEIATHVAFGAPARVLAEHAEHDHFDLVVVGTRGRGPVGRTFLGSVSSALVHQCRRPVLVVPEELE